jgi:phosphoglycolate phosphatase
MHKIENVFFDLDGTISDPAKGITESIVYALDKMGYKPLPAPETLTWLIGPPLRDYFHMMLGDGHIDEAIAHYRHRYDTENACLTENEIIEGMWFTISQLWRASKNLYVITTKPTKIAKKILTHLEIRDRFKGVFGSYPDETGGDKGELIARVLECRKIDPASAVMIGDREYDIRGAAKNSVRSIGVAWGFGSIEELEEAGATTIVRQPQDLLKILIKSKKVET